MWTASRDAAASGPDRRAAPAASDRSGGHAPNAASSSWIGGSIEVSEEQLVGDAAALVVGVGDAAAAIASARTRSRPATRER
jgi:hypothetical protein